MQNVYEILEKYDEERVLPTTRKKITLTLAIKTIKKLKKLSEEQKKPISRIVDSMLKKH